MAIANSFAVRVENMAKVYHLGGEDVHALRGVTLDFPEGDYVAVMGPLSILLPGVAGQRDQPGVPHRGVAAEGSRHPVAIHTGQADVAEDHVGAHAPGQ